MPKGTVKPTNYRRPWPTRARLNVLESRIRTAFPDTNDEMLCLLLMHRLHHGLSVKDLHKVIRDLVRVIDE